MNLIKLDAIESTNTYLLQLSRKKVLENPTVVIANKQLQGRGQMGTTWISEAEKSLAFSVYKRFDDLRVINQFTILEAVSVGILDALQQLSIPELAIKWPNDIMSYSKKLVGILIENQVKQGKIVSSIIGVGLNVNSNLLKDLPFATSMQIETGKSYPLEEVFEIVLKQIVLQLDLLDTKQTSNLKENYEKVLFRKEKITVFETQEGRRFNGIIKGVSQSGELQILLENDAIQQFKLKEIKMLRS